MKVIRTKVTIKGVEVEMLFTPRLYCFKGLQGVTLSGDTSELSQVFSLYADILYCAALNAWTLEGNDVEDAPFKRADFHEFSASNPQAFGKAIDFALKALSGKSLKDFIGENKKAAENGNKAANEGEELKKKSLFRSIMARLRHS